jgi:hypothetical protein
MRQANAGTRLDGKQSTPPQIAPVHRPFDVLLQLSLTLPAFIYATTIATTATTATAASITTIVIIATAAAALWSIAKLFE